MRDTRHRIATDQERPSRRHRTGSASLLGLGLVQALAVLVALEFLAALFAAMARTGDVLFHLLRMRGRVLAALVRAVLTSGHVIGLHGAVRTSVSPSASNALANDLQTKGII